MALRLRSEIDFLNVGQRSELSNFLKEDLIRIIEWEFTLSNSI